MIFHADTAYDELYVLFQERVRRDEPLARHCAFGVGGTVDIWVSLESRKELIGLVCLCAEEHWPLLTVGNSTNVLYADAGVRGIVARLALKEYRIEEHGDGTALLVADAGVSWPFLLHELAILGWGGLEFGAGIPGTLGGGVISNAGAHNSDLGHVLQWLEVLDARGSAPQADRTSPTSIWYCFQGPTRTRHRFAHRADWSEGKDTRKSSNLDGSCKLHREFGGRASC